MAKKKIITPKKSVIFKTYDEAVNNLFPGIQKEDEQKTEVMEEEKEKMKELADTVLSRF